MAQGLDRITWWQESGTSTSSISWVWAETQGNNEPTIVPEANSARGPRKLAQQVYATFLVSGAEPGTQAHPIVDNTLAHNGLVVWGRIAHGFGPRPAQAGLSLSKRFKPPNGKFDYRSFLSERWALTHDTKRAIVMDVCLVEFQQDMIPKSDSFNIDPNVKAATRGWVGHMRHKPDSMETDEMAKHADV